MKSLFEENPSERHIKQDHVCYNISWSHCLKRTRVNATSNKTMSVKHFMKSLFEENPSERHIKQDHVC